VSTIFPREWAERMASLPGGTTELATILGNFERAETAALAAIAAAEAEVDEAVRELDQIRAERAAVADVLRACANGEMRACCDQPRPSTVPEPAITARGPGVSLQS
jgi:hypothetical protein